jgi:hypothetical protein
MPKDSAYHSQLLQEEFVEETTRGLSEKVLGYGTYEAKRMAYSDTVEIEAKGLIEILANAATAVTSIGVMHNDALGRLAEIEGERSRLEKERNELIEVRNSLRRKVVTVIREMHETGGTERCFRNRGA